MDDKIKKLEIKRLFQEYVLLNTDNEYKQEIISEYKTVFLEKVGELKKEMFPQIVLPENEQESKEETINETEKTSEEKSEPKEEDKKQEELPKKNKIDESSINESTRVKVKRMYREIVKITHPDRNDTDKYLETHLKATMAAEEFNLFELYIICVELDIAIELDSEDKEMLTKLIEEKKKKNKMMENSFIWLWINAKNDADKNNIVKVFVNQTTKR
jgi:hypothetical protein